VVKFTGRIPFPEIPSYVALFDVAVVSAGSANDFHYSPLKLPEYMAAHKAVMAPRAGAVPKLFQDRKEILLYEVGNIADMVNKLSELISKVDLRTKLAEAGNQQVLKTGTWSAQLQQVTDHLLFE
jgi:glycosyltransferase involved in cell wall biosynthesis